MMRLSIFKKQKEPTGIPQAQYATVVPTTYNRYVVIKLHEDYSAYFILYSQESPEAVALLEAPKCSPALFSEHATKIPLMGVFIQESAVTGTIVLNYGVTTSLKSEWIPGGIGAGFESAVKWLRTPTNYLWAQHVQANVSYAKHEEKTIFSIKHV